MIDYKEAGRQILEKREFPNQIGIQDAEHLRRGLNTDEFQQSPQPPLRSLNHDVDSLVASLMDLNDLLANMRGRLYGDGDVEARKKLENRPLQSVQTCIEDAQMQLRIAHDQVQEILKRL